MSTATSLADEHALLRREVRSRAEAVVKTADEDRWPGKELRALVDYLHLEVLRQLADEEWLLFRTARQAPDQLARLRRDHLELRLSVDELTAAAVGAGNLTAAQLVAATRDLVAQFDAHLAGEEQVLAASESAPPSTASLGSQPHEWYSVIEAQVIDLDELPGAQGADAVFSRLLRLRVGELIELQSTTDPSPLLRRLRLSDPAGYTVTYVERGPARWHVEVVRRPPEPPLSPAAG